MGVRLGLKGGKHGCKCDLRDPRVAWSETVSRSSLPITGVVDREDDAGDGKGDGRGLGEKGRAWFTIGANNAANDGQEDGAPKTSWDTKKPLFKYQNYSQLIINRVNSLSQRH